MYNVYPRAFAFFVARDMRPSFPCRTECRKEKGSWNCLSCIPVLHLDWTVFGVWCCCLVAFSYRSADSFLGLFRDHGQDCPNDLL